MTGLSLPPRRSSRDRSRREMQEEWENRELMHAVLKHQFGNGAAIRVGAVFERHVLQEVAAEVARRIENIPRGRQFLEHRRARFLVDAVRQVVRSGSERARKALLAEAAELAGIEVRWLAKTGKEVLGVNFRTPAPALVEAAITKTPLLGRPFGEWFEDWIPRATEARIVGRVRAGMLAGETTPQIVRSLQGTKALRYTDGKLVESRRAVTMLTRTTITHTSNVAHMETFRRNSDVIDKVRWMATLDLRVCPICASLDGRQWDVGVPHPEPPIHPDDRCLLVPQIGPRTGERASLGGRVDGRIDYPDWLKTRSVEDQNTVLGRTRAEAWRAGKLSIDEMVDASLTRNRTLEELRTAQKI